MALSLTYDPQLSRVRVQLTGLVDLAVYRLERSTDQVRWTTVRGGGSIVPASGNAQVDDYEFAPGVANYYRVVGPSVWDLFSRTVAAGSWGAATSGHTWTSAPQLSVDGSAGLVTHDVAAQTVVATLNTPTGVGKVNVAVSVRVPVLAAGGQFETALLVRRVDANNYYMANLLWNTTGSLVLQLIRNVAATFTTLASSTLSATYSGSQTMRIRIDGDGSLLRVKVWPATSPEPDAWTVEASDGTHTAGQIGIRSRRGTGNTNGITATRWDDLLVAVPEGTAFAVTTMSPWLTDTFTRSVSSGWGTSDSGAVWTVHGGADLSHFGVDGAVGWHDAQYSDVTKRSLTAGPADGEATYTFSIPVMPSGEAPQSGFMVREDGANTAFYIFRWILTIEGQVEMRISYRDGPNELTLVNDVGTYGAYSAGSLIHCKCRWEGPYLAMKVWVDGGSEPAGWQLSVLDTRYSGAGRIGMRSTVGTFWEDWTGPVPLRFSYYDLSVVEIHATSTTPAIDGVWLKSVARPFLNRQVTVMDFSEVSRPTRGGVFEVVGRSFPVAVTDVRGSRRWTLQLSTDTPQEANNLDLLLAGGDILLVQVPQGSGRISAVPGGYVTVGDTRVVTPPTYDLQMRVLELPLVEVAAPGPDVVGATVTCQTVLNVYPTVQAVIDAHDTIVDLLELVGDPTDVVVA